MINIDEYDTDEYEKEALKEIRADLSKLDTLGQISYLSDILCQEFYLVDHQFYIGRVLTELLIANGVSIKDEL